MDEREELTQSRISRRTMIKGAGAGAALAWVAPSVISMGASAFAASNKCTSCAPCVGPTCAANSACLCFPLANGTCFCVAPRVCPGGGPGSAPVCATDADCAAAEPGVGSRCISSCCGTLPGGGSCGAPCTAAAKPLAPTGNTQRG